MARRRSDTIMYKRAMIQVKFYDRPKEILIFGQDDKSSVISNGVAREYPGLHAYDVYKLAQGFWSMVGHAVLRVDVTPSPSLPEEWALPTTFPGVTVTLDKMGWYTEKDAEPDNSHKYWHLSLNKPFTEIVEGMYNDDGNTFSDQFVYLICEYLYQKHGLSHGVSALAPHSPTGDMYCDLSIRLVEPNMVKVTNEWNRDV